jgi:hypothetical protein
MQNAQIDHRLEQMQTSGYCILPNVIPPDRCATIRDSLLETVRRERHKYANAPAKVAFTPSIINHDQSFAEYLADEELLALIGRLLGEHLRISFTSAIINEQGNARGGWHADWPFNQKNAGHIPAPYPDVVMHITTLWMLSPFEAENGGTLILPGSHRRPSNPTALAGAVSGDHLSNLPGQHEEIAEETSATGSAGSVLVMDSRLWHATAPNSADEPRVALAVRYAPWWLNLEVLRPESNERKHMCDESGKTENVVPSIDPHIYDHLPTNVQPLFRHWVGPRERDD